MQISANEIVNRFVRVSDVAIELPLRDAVGCETERPRIVVAGLAFARGEAPPSLTIMPAESVLEELTPTSRPVRAKMPLAGARSWWSS